MKNLYRLTAFPKDKNGGNKAGVYLNADHLTEQEMQSIAKDVGYSETAFVLKSKIADFKVRFFTPLNEVDLCGHATIATFNLLRMLKIIGVGDYSQETKAGLLKCHVDKDFVWMQQVKPMFGQIINEADISNCFKNICLDHRFKPQVVSTGLKEIFVGVKNRQTLKSLKPDFDSINHLLISTQTEGIHVFTLDQEVDAYGRNFIPLLGVEEESATGTSNGALSCYLYKYYSKKNTFTLRQGYEMNLPSEIHSRLIIDHDTIQEVWVGGQAYMID